MRIPTIIEICQGRLVTILKVLGDDSYLLCGVDLDCTFFTILGSIAEEMRRTFFAFARRGCWSFPSASLDAARGRTEPVGVGGTTAAAGLPALGARTLDGEEEGATTAAAVALPLSLLTLSVIGMPTLYSVGHRPTVEQQWTICATYTNGEVVELSTVAVGSGPATAANTTIVRAAKATATAGVGAGIDSIVESRDGRAHGQQEWDNSLKMHFE
ncbi:MAG: hypothetical protein Q9193_000720 [Seirophora villosa]